MNENSDTKKRIFEVAIELFSLQGYHNVSMRQIANQVGIKQSSIYHHYESKEAILCAIYDYFDTNMTRLAPNLDQLLAMVETHSPHEVMRGTVFVFPEEEVATMGGAMLVASALVRSDSRANELITKNLLELPRRYDECLLGKMMELDLIEPIDVDGFVLLHSSYCHSTAVRSFMDRMVSTDIWIEGLELLFSLIKPKEKGSRTGRPS